MNELYVLRIEIQQISRWGFWVELIHWTAKGVAHLVNQLVCRVDILRVYNLKIMGVGVVPNNDGILNDSIAEKCQR